MLVEVSLFVNAIGYLVYCCVMEPPMKFLYFVCFHLCWESRPTAHSEIPISRNRKYMLMLYLRYGQGLSNDYEAVGLVLSENMSHKYCIKRFLMTK